MRRLLFASAVCCASLAHAQSPADYADAKARADADEASLPATAASAMRDAQGAALDAAITGCATPTADTSPFVVVAELDATGKVVRTWRDGATPLAICVQKQIAGSALSAPPRAPFFTSFELSFTR
ncbi:hypothetical protein [Pseudoxanthomonas sp. PXM01]|uniref:hypothetical protein n=1 Tax=Pseudoxanthomonas sp. PXM01 TaxID=2769295 RepID=UPI0017854BF1|nr:hypothetical protein [Pseudoxanthomonas sp. PXM01]MBD9469260.1 hypothetical protein [Pseudoxanthomonas sp. PXM01]